MTNEVRVRFAPSPTGALHIGGVRTALWDWLFARHTGGKFILRIEDTDKNREVPGGVQMIIDTLNAYGLTFDEGPGVGGDYGPYIQSERLEHYQKAAEQLIASGHAYYAYDTPEELKAYRESQEKRGQSTGYSRRHRYLSAEDRARYEAERREFRVVRLAVPREGATTFQDAVWGEITYENKQLDDAVLLKSDGFPTYHLASVVDDYLMRISHVLRGEDWIPSTPLHLLTYQALGWEPPTFVHLPNMLGLDGKKLSKRHGAQGGLEYLEEGYLLEALLNFLAMQGWSPKEDRDLYSVEELIEKFSLEGILSSSPRYDAEKLLWYNGQYIRAMSLSELAARTLPYLQKAGLVGAEPDVTELSYIGHVLKLEQERMKLLQDAAFPPIDPISKERSGQPLADFFLLPDDQFAYDEKAVQKWFTQPTIAERLTRVREGFANLEVFDEAGTEAVVRSTATELGLKPAEVIHPTRVAATGRTTGPGLFETLAVLGRDRCLRRFDRALEMSKSLSSGQA